MHISISGPLQKDIERALDLWDKTLGLFEMNIKNNIIPFGAQDKIVKDFDKKFNKKEKKCTCVKNV